MRPFSLKHCFIHTNSLKKFLQLITFDTTHSWCNLPPPLVCFLREEVISNFQCWPPSKGSTGKKKLYFFGMTRFRYRTQNLPYLIMTLKQVNRGRVKETKETNTKSKVFAIMFVACFLLENYQSLNVAMSIELLSVPRLIILLAALGSVDSFLPRNYR